MQKMYILKSISGAASAVLMINMMFFVERMTYFFMGDGMYYFALVMAVYAMLMICTAMPEKFNFKKIFLVFVIIALIPFFSRLLSFESVIAITKILMIGVSILCALFVWLITRYWDELSLDDHFNTQGINGLINGVLCMIAAVLVIDPLEPNESLWLFGGFFFWNLFAVAWLKGVYKSKQGLALQIKHDPFSSWG